MWYKRIIQSSPDQKTKPSFNGPKENNLSHSVSCCVSVSRSERRWQIAGPCRRAEEAVAHESDDIKVIVGDPWSSILEPGKEARWTGD